METDQAGNRLTDSGNGFPFARKRQRERFLGGGEFGFSDGIFAYNAFQLLVHFKDRFLCFVGLHWSYGNERPLTTRTDKSRMRAIGPMLVLAQIHVDA